MLLVVGKVLGGGGKGVLPSLLLILTHGLGLVAEQAQLVLFLGFALTFTKVSSEEVLVLLFRVIDVVVSVVVSVALGVVPVILPVGV